LSETKEAKVFGFEEKLYQRSQSSVFHTGSSGEASDWLATDHLHHTGDNQNLWVIAISAGSQYTQLGNYIDFQIRIHVRR
jgi:hypothetical protein